MGIQLEWVDFRRRPTVWQCDKCKTEYRLPVDFYEDPVRFQPEAFADIEKIREHKFIREYGHVSVTWLRRGLLFWDKNRGYLSGVILWSFVISVICLLIKEQFFDVDFLFYPSLVWLVLLPVLFTFDLTSWLVAKVFLMIYKLKKL